MVIEKVWNKWIFSDSRKKVTFPSYFIWSTSDLHGVSSLGSQYNIAEARKKLEEYRFDFKDNSLDFSDLPKGHGFTVVMKKDGSDFPYFLNARNWGN